jgi:MFS family permease
MKRFSLNSSEIENPKQPKGLKVIFRSLRYRNFRLFFSGQSISLIGTWIQQTAMPWLVYDVTHSIFLLGLIAFTGQIPTLLLSSVAGVITDRKNKYHLLITTQILAMTQALILAMILYFGHIQVWHIVLLSIFLGCINSFDVPVRQSFMIEMVEDKKDLGNAIALNSTMVNGARLIGPSIAGVLIATMGEGPCFLINGLSYIVVIVSLFLMKIIPKKIEKKPGLSFGKELREGFSYAFGFIPIKFIILLLTLISLTGLPYAVLMPAYSKEILHGDSHTFGFLMGATGLGAMSGAIYLASRRSVPGLERLIPMAAALFGAGLISVSVSRIFVVSLLLMVITGMGMMIVLASSNTILQTITDDDKRGRVMSIYTMAFMGTAPFGSLIAGSLASLTSVPFTLILGGSSCIVGAIIYAYNLPNLDLKIRAAYERTGIIKGSDIKLIKNKL